MDNRFRNAQNGRLLRALFFETSEDTEKKYVLYTLKDEDHNGYPSLRRLYLETNDLTEYEFSSLHLDGWDHWEMLCRCSWFKPIVQRWRRELQLKFESQALKVIKLEADNPTSQNKFQANKIILDRIAKLNPTKVRGRPSKDEVDAELKQQVQIEKELQEDMKRIATVGREGNP